MIGWYGNPHDVRVHDRLIKAAQAEIRATIIFGGVTLFTNRIRYRHDFLHYDYRGSDARHAR